MEKPFLFCAVIVAFGYTVFGASTEEEGFQTNSERFRRIEEKLQKLETENKNLHSVVQKQKNEISILVQEQKVHRREINELKHSCLRKTTRREVAAETTGKSQHPLFATRNATKDDFISLDKSEKWHKDGERRDIGGNQYKIRLSRLLEGGSNSETETNDVAFYAYMSKTEAIIPHHTLIFDHVETNIGHAYSQHSGAFTVPINGVYILSYTVFPNGSGSYASVELTVNSISRNKIFVDSSSTDNDHTGCTGFAVLALNQGDVCFVRLHPTYLSKGNIESGSLMRSSFSGVKV
ncbi:uncharacterized protein LOC134694342 [Mytilus trossulus]|uniref:uncharacterized protein LOC134694342 n=1 Tax=Mytilus trossulus TaxID=6551 RepID=UPI0030058943